MGPSLRSLSNSILKSIDEAYREYDDVAGWGQYPGEGVSITNTGEALLTLDALNEVGDYTLSRVDKSKIVDYLERNLDRILNDEPIRTRDLALGCTGLSLCGDHSDLVDRAGRKLQDIASGGGWPSRSDGRSRVSLIPTFQAMKALRYAGIDARPENFEWLSRLKTSGGLYGFSDNDREGSVAASSLVLYLTADSPFADRQWNVELLSTMKVRWGNDAVTIRDGRDWVGEDSQSHFKLYWFGHLLTAYDLYSVNLAELDVRPFLQYLIKVSQSEGTDDEFRDVASDRMHLPLLLELGMSCRALVSNYDPLRYYATIEEIISQYDQERAKQEDESLTERLRSVEPGSCIEAAMVALRG